MSGFVLPPLRPLDYAPPPGLPVIHVDAHLLAVDKPSGLLTVPGREAALADCVAARAEAAFPGARIVHRLDMDTSGVLVLARTPEAQRHLGLQFERRHAAKLYEAVVAGLPTQEAGTVDLPLATDWPERPRQRPTPEGRRAITEWEVLARDPNAAPRGAARLALRPLTGRSHQLRAHLLAMGHPILGDALYADDAAYAAAPRLMLHARRLELRHPVGGAPLTLEAPCPF
ncbi:RluA family pseudouridine synthase [Albimonas sp. CAU 1670]|uniref:RluA family pseudouridine synthase n=1 Tax=Albimonas sp. CAU 1670 TaxID=3032599 RepID=UPI0023DAE78A|nr:RluA family pseudouridine synthase [Albimonas sp. CAU 1670]MDF2234270.1 RluA family pseudouridine synthase [Albimonas sp. CAU 1670]